MDRVGEEKHHHLGNTQYPVLSAGHYDSYVAIKIVALPPKTSNTAIPNPIHNAETSSPQTNLVTPSKMGFEFTSAFDLSAEEKHSILADINSLLQQTAMQTDFARQNRSLHDYAEALDTVNEALALAGDADACDADMAPLATCHLYKGHILLALNQYADAYDAYTIAATANTSALMESDASKEAAKRALRLRDKAVESKRTGGVYWRKRVFANAWKSACRIGRDVPRDVGRTAQMGLDYYISGIVLPVTIRPGPVVKKPLIIGGSTKKVGPDEKLGLTRKEEQ